MTQAKGRRLTDRATQVPLYLTDVMDQTSEIRQVQCPWRGVARTRAEPMLPDVHLTSTVFKPHLTWGYQNCLTIIPLLWPSTFSTTFLYCKRCGNGCFFVLPLASQTPPTLRSSHGHILLSANTFWLFLATESARTGSPHKYKG